MASNQQLTREWWTRRSQDFELCVSQFVLDEASLGDPEAARRRLEFLANVPLLDASDEVHILAEELYQRIPLPAKARTDSLHIAIAAVNGIDYLLTWNCTHIANATTRPIIELICRKSGHEPPIICTPQELLKE
jgi:hypothetical protein